MNVSCAWVKFHLDWVEFSDGFGLPPILENTQSCKKMGEDKLVKDFLKIHTPLKTNMETGTGLLEMEIP